MKPGQLRDQGKVFKGCTYCSGTISLEAQERGCELCSRCERMYNEDQEKKANVEQLRLRIIDCTTVQDVKAILLEIVEMIEARA